MDAPRFQLLLHVVKRAHMFWDPFGLVPAGAVGPILQLGVDRRPENRRRVVDDVEIAVEVAFDRRRDDGAI